MTPELPFDHRPDPRLGEALRALLDPGDSTAFVARVLARADRARLSTWDAVLAGWARVGVAAAMIVALTAGYVLGRAPGAPASGRVSVVDTLLAARPPAVEAAVVLASFVGN